MLLLKIIRKFLNDRICYNPSKLVYTLEFTFAHWENMLNLMGLMTWIIANQIKVRIWLHLLPERKIVQK